MGCSLLLLQECGFRKILGDIGEKGYWRFACIPKVRREYFLARVLGTLCFLFLFYHVNIIIYIYILVVSSMNLERRLTTLCPLKYYHSVLTLTRKPSIFLQ